MKKITLLITFLMAIVTGGYGQSASTYGFSSSSGTYTNNSAAATLLATVRADSFISTVQPIGFTFVYEGANFTQFKMSSNGFISLGAGTNAQDTNNFSTANATSRPIIAPLWDDLDGVSPASSVACYELTGVAPNRVLTVEWRNWEWNWNSATPVISFQAKLYETTNVIEFVYRQEATAINAGSASIGIGSATGSGAGSYLNLTSIAAPAVSSTASTTTLATKPATGQVYTFTPPMPCTGTPNGGTVSPTSFVLNTGQLPGTIVASGFTSGVTGLTFQWEESTDGFVTPVNAVGGTGATTVSYTPPAYNGTPKEYRLKVTCSGNPGSPGYSSTSSLVSCGPVSVFPWTENFDSLATLGATVFPSCWTKENGDWATTNNANSTTDADARSGTQFLRDSWSATNEYVWTKGFQLTAGTSYDFSFYWAGDTFSGWTGDVFYNTTPNSVGATQLGGSFVAPGTTTTFTYAKSLSTFVPSSSGVYYFAIRVNQPSATPNYLSFDDFRFEPSPACPAPLALTVGNITSNTADFNWTPGASEALWNVQYGPTGFALGTGTIINGEINPTYTAIGLTGNTTYQYYVQADCGAGSTSGWAGPISFTTACNATSIPYAQNFESVTTPALPSCTSVVNAGSGNLWKTTSNPGYGFTTKVLNYTYNSTNPANTWFFTQGINLTGGVSYRISYNYGNDSTTYTEKLQVAYGTSASAAAMTNVIATHATINQQAIQSNLVDFTPATTGVYYFGFQAYSALDQDNLYVDNILIDATPACPSPTALTAGNFTSNTADFVWTPGASEALWNVQYGPTGFVLGTGTIVNGEINPTYTATGLSANTTYQYYVQADCTGVSGTSTWAGPFSFTTYCDAVTDFTQNFDAVTAPAMPDCWNKVGTTGTTNTQTASNNTAPNTLYLYSSSAANKVVLRTVPVSNLGDGTHWLRFKMRASGTVGGIVEIGYVTDPADANSFVSLGSVTASTLTYQDYNFTPAAGSYSNYLALRHTGAPANSVLIDDVAWEVIPSCYPPTALLAGNSTANTADFNWTPGGSEGLWNIQYGPTGFVVGTGTIISGEINPTYTAVGLLANTTYQYYVQADCGGSTSTWAGPISFTTACDATNVPYVQNFESVTTPAIPACTSVINEGTGNLWKTVSNPGAGFTTKTLSYTYNSANPANTWFFTQAINMTGGVSYRISYNYGNDSTFYTEKLKVAYGTSASGAGMTDVIADHPTINQQAIQSNVVDFTPATTGVYYIGFQAYSTANQDNLFVDNISVDLTPACSNPIGLAVNNLTDVGANITWTATSGNYQYVLDNVATDPAGAGTTLAGEAYSAGPLSPTTLYYFHVRTDCGGLFSTWSTISFTTLMPPPVNNDLCNAIALTVGNISAGDAFTNVGSTGQTNEPAPACFNSGINGSVWFSFVSPASGNVQVTTDIAGGTLTDTEIAVYNGTGVTCGDLTTLAAALGCSQDDGVGVDFNSTLNLTGLVSGGTYYVQVDRWGTATDGTFGINVTDSGLSTPSFDTAGFRAYPNPVKDILNLSYTKEMSSVSVFNLLGQEVLTKTVNATQSQVNLSGLSGGTYLVKVTVDGLVKTIKVVKE